MRHSPLYASILAITMLSIALPAAADEKEVHLDLWVTAIDGVTVTGGWDHDTGNVVNPFQRVFDAELGLDATFPFSGDEPGIGSNLVGSSITMNLLQGLGAWNGSGFSASTYALLASYGGQDASSATGGSFSFLVTQGLDLHPEYTLSAQSGDPDNGIYLAAFTVAAGSNAVSDTFWVVFNLGMAEADHEAAVEWAEANLVPAPGILAAAAIAGLTSARSRTRRR
ncbi:MAG: hypothetical protein FJ260_05320 [Planctomycetes bacterium]|nr:hypothetical protein [Planctomycetota bacterium]